jgi:serine protease Do
VTKVELTDGIVAAIRHGGDLIQITAPISHGSSGSPVLTDQGKLIGVAVAGIEQGQNLNFAISAVWREVRFQWDKG